MNIVNRLIIAFLIVSLNLSIPAIMALLITKGLAAPSYHDFDIAKQTDADNGTVRKVTAYNVGDPKQTHSRPCIGAGGDNLCRLVNEGTRVCAANFVPLKSKLHIDKLGECIVLDKMNARFGNRVDIAMKKNEHRRAVKFGVQRLTVIQN